VRRKQFFVGPFSLRFDNSLGFPGIDICAVNSLLIRKDILNTFENLTATLFCCRCQYRGGRRTRSAVFARPVTLLMTIVGSWLLTFPSCNGW
jgi:hypothetical protein